MTITKKLKPITVPTRMKTNVLIILFNPFEITNNISLMLLDLLIDLFGSLEEMTTKPPKRDTTIRYRVDSIKGKNATNNNAPTIVQNINYKLSVNPTI